MRAYLRVGDGGELPLEEPVGLYRDVEADHRLVADVGGTERHLSLSDPTVSRPTEAGPPVELVPRERWVEVRNNGNENGVTVATSDGSEAVADGFATRVDRDATLEIGARTRLQLVVEREPRTEEYTIRHEGDGDVVLGDQSVTEVDERTSVGDDNVIKGDIGADPDTAPDVEGAIDLDTVPEAGSEDDAGEPDEDATYCERHDRTFTGAVCPDCARQFS